MLGEVRAGRREVAGDRGASRAQGRGLDCRFGAGHGEERTWNISYMFVTLEVSKLSGWLKARASCRVERRAYGAERGAAREAEGRRATAVHVACRAGLDCRLGARHGEERTSNMRVMSVTLDVSKLSGWLNAVALCRVERRACDAGREMRAGEAGGRGAMTAQAACTRGRF